MSARTRTYIAAAFAVSIGGARPALADPSAHDQALGLFKKSRDAYNATHFQDAVDDLKAAYALEPAAVLLFNLAKAYEALGDIRNAAATYEQYLAEEKEEIKDRAVIEEKVKNFKKRIDEEDRLKRERDEALNRLHAKAPDAPTTPPTSTGGHISPAPWVILGVGVAGVGVGAVLGGLALSKNKDADAALSQKDAVDLHDAAKGLALGSTAAFIAGGVVTGGSLLWGIIDVATTKRAPTSSPSTDEAPATDATTTSLQIGPGYIGLKGTFF